MIERLYVNNYRCLENFSLDLSGQKSAVLLGRNGAGKTTVVDALRVLQSICRGPNRVKDVIRSRDFARFDNTRLMRFELDLAINSAKYVYSVSFEWPRDFFEARVAEESLVKDGVPVFTRERSQVTISDKTTFGLDWHVFAIPVINERPSENSIQSVKAFLSRMLLLSPSPHQMLGFSDGADSDLDQYGSTFSSNLRTLLQKKPRAYAEFADFIKEVIPDFSSIENVDRGKEGGSQLTVTFDVDEPSKSLTVDFDSLSAGEKCFFLAAFVVASNAVRSGQDPQVVCVWDEPDNHLSLSQVGHFITALKKMANRGGQFIATTHHPETIRKFSSENTYVLTRHSHLEPTVVRLLKSFSFTGDLIHALVREEIIG